MLSLSLCVLLPEAAKLRKRQEGTKALLKRLSDEFIEMDADSFSARFLKPLRVLKYPEAEALKSDLYSQKFVLENGLELLLPKHEPVLFQSLIKDLIRQESNSYGFEYNDEEIVFIMSRTNSQEMALTIEIKMIQQVLGLLETEPSPKKRVREFQKFCEEFLKDPSTPPIRGSSPKRLVEDLVDLHQLPRKLDLTQIQLFNV